MKLRACFSNGGRWTPSEDRPSHVTEDREKTLCGVTNIEVFLDPELHDFRAHRDRCLRCEKILEGREES